MGRKAKYTVEQKVKACEDYLSGNKSAIKISQELHMGKHGRNVVYQWVKSFEKNGRRIFELKSKNNSYSKNFKEMVVKEYLGGEGSLSDLAAKHGIPKDSIILNWVKKYNSHIELVDYNPKPEVYMANTLKTTLEERIEIVKYCLEHNKDYKDTAEHFGGNYAQIYNWVKRYIQDGEDGLSDKRGKRKKEEELTDLEKANRRIQQLEKENERQRMELELLKKLEALERKW